MHKTSKAWRVAKVAAELERLEDEGVVYSREDAEDWVAAAQRGEWPLVMRCRTSP